MDEITMFASLRPQAPDDADLNEMRTGARRRFTTAVTPKARWRKPMLAAGLAAAVAGGAAAAVVLTSGGAPLPTTRLNNVVTAAWTVRQNTDGTVTIDVRQYAHPAQLQKVLRDDGLNAYVRWMPWRKIRDGSITMIAPTCDYAHTNEAPHAVQKAVVTSTLPRGWTINPAAMPAGSALFLAGGPVTVRGSEKLLYGSQPVVLNSSKLPACVPFTPPPPPKHRQ